MVSSLYSVAHSSFVNKIATPEVGVYQKTSLKNLHEEFSIGDFGNDLVLLLFTTNTIYHKSKRSQAAMKSNRIIRSSSFLCLDGWHTDIL